MGYFIRDRLFDKRKFLKTAFREKFVFSVFVIFSVFYRLLLENKYFLKRAECLTYSELRIYCNKTAPVNYLVYYFEVQP